MPVDLDEVEIVQQHHDHGPSIRHASRGVNRAPETDRVRCGGKEFWGRSLFGRTGKRIACGENLKPECFQRQRGLQIVAVDWRDERLDLYAQKPLDILPAFLNLLYLTAHAKT